MAGYVFVDFHRITTSSARNVLTEPLCSEIKLIYKEKEQQKFKRNEEIE